MDYFKSFSEMLFDPGEFNFTEKALELFYFQARHNRVYRAYINARGIQIDQVKRLEQIPFLPVQFFKTHKVVCGNETDFNDFYSSSGTTGSITSRHYIWDEGFYLEHARRIFERRYGPLENFHVLALLPAYLERKGSSLVAMANYFIQKSKSRHSGFYLYNYEDLKRKLMVLQESPKQILLFGVTFALLDIAELGLSGMDNLTVMETGGMKGRKREMIREEVHDILCRQLEVDAVHSEYGMTELMSQAYSSGQGKYQLPPTMQVFLRDMYDPFSVSKRSRGGVNIIDLANFHSCAFIETQDLGSYDDDGNLEILGRFDNSEIRGCNLMVN